HRLHVEHFCHPRLALSVLPGGWGNTESVASEDRRFSGGRIGWCEDDFGKCGEGFSGLLSGRDCYPLGRFDRRVHLAKTVASKVRASVAGSRTTLNGMLTSHYANSSCRAASQTATTAGCLSLLSTEIAKKRWRMAFTREITFTPWRRQISASIAVGPQKMP